MKNIPIRNKDVLEALNNWLWYYDNRDLVLDTLQVNGNPKDREHFVGEQYRDEIIAIDTMHDGFPASIHGCNIKGSHLQAKNGAPVSTEVSKLVERYNRYNQELCTLLSARNNALTELYPPNGYISWHNNANASAYNLIFSWSEMGDGCFKYVDGHTGKMVTMQDVQGWQCKAGYFGAYHEPWYNRVYHAAETNCWRISVSYIFDRSDMALGIQDDVVEEIMSEF